MSAQMWPCDLTRVYFGRRRKWNFLEHLMLWQVVKEIENSHISGLNNSKEARAFILLTSLAQVIPNSSLFYANCVS